MIYFSYQEFLMLHEAVKVQIRLEEFLGEDPGSEVEFLEEKRLCDFTQATAPAHLSIFPPIISSKE